MTASLSSGASRPCRTADGEPCQGRVARAAPPPRHTHSRARDGRRWRAGSSTSSSSSAATARGTGGRRSSSSAETALPAEPARRRCAGTRRRPAGRRAPPRRRAPRCAAPTAARSAGTTCVAIGERPARQLGQGRGLHVAEHGHRDRARDRRRGHDQHVRRLGPLLPQRVSLLDAEPVLLVDDDQGEVVELRRSPG